MTNWTAGPWPAKRILEAAPAAVDSSAGQGPAVQKSFVASIYRHPVKGFTPERLQSVELHPGCGFAFDRVFAVEDGPSGFDPERPAHVPKMKFTVLAKIPKIARARTRFDESSGVLSVETDEDSFAAKLTDEEGRAAFAEWLGAFLGDDAAGALRVIPAPGAHRFFDHPQGHVSLINLASVRDLATKLARPVDPLRFRANLYVEGWPPWVELDAVNARVRLGDAEARVFKPITRCAAPHVDPERGVRDIEIVGELQRLYGHALCGAYLQVARGGLLKEGDSASLDA